MTYIFVFLVALVAASLLLIIRTSTSSASLRNMQAVATAAVVLMLAMPASGQSSLLVSAHYDVAREAPIASVVYTKVLPAKMFATGFFETWRNNGTGFPANEWSVLSKHWVSRAITNRLSASVELEFVYNRPGVSFTYPHPVDFRFGDPRLHFTPKLGFSYRLL